LLRNFAVRSNFPADSIVVEHHEVTSIWQPTTGENQLRQIALGELRAAFRAVGLAQYREHHGLRRVPQALFKLLLLALAQLWRDVVCAISFLDGRGATLAELQVDQAARVWRT
jgi:hypothetical protein